MPDAKKKDTVKTEEKAKAVASVCKAEFLAALAV